MGGPCRPSALRRDGRNWRGVLRGRRRARGLHDRRRPVPRRPRQRALSHVLVIDPTRLDPMLFDAGYLDAIYRRSSRTVARPTTTRLGRPYSGASANKLLGRALAPMLRELARGLGRQAAAARPPGVRAGRPDDARFLPAQFDVYRRVWPDTEAGRVRRDDSPTRLRARSSASRSVPRSRGTRRISDARAALGRSVEVVDALLVRGLGTTRAALESPTWRRPGRSSRFPATRPPTRSGDSPEFTQDAARDLRSARRAGAGGPGGAASPGSWRRSRPQGSLSAFFRDAREAAGARGLALGRPPEEAVRGGARVPLHVVGRAEGGALRRARRQQDRRVLAAPDVDPLRRSARPAGRRTAPSAIESPA